ncbi:MAG: hypothetical protein IJA34_00505 [Lachnospiraceae bacterium]|nr:hypothetical protein [Lachnospiraceae bacterium]
MAKYKEFTLSDGKKYILRKGSIVRTVDDAWHGDYKAAIVRNTLIPKETEVVVENWFLNFYGEWITVIYNNLPYDIKPSKLEFVIS